MIDYNALKIPVDYDSPLIINYVEQMATDIPKFIDDGVMKAVIKAGFDIDKNKLVQIFEQDKERYSEAYRKGFAEGYKKRDDEIVRCMDCKNADYGTDEDGNRFMKCIGSVKCYGGTTQDFFCADGVKRDEEQ